MEHYDSAQWSDFVRGLIEPETARAMAKHLEGGCPRCAAVASALRRVSALAVAESASQPPPGAVRLAKAYFGVQAPARESSLQRLAMRLVADSTLRSAAANVRNDRAEGQSLTYRGSELNLELDLLPESRGDEMLLVGELTSETSGPVAGAPAFVVSWDRVTSHTSTDESGRFALSRSPRGEARLCLVVGDDAMVNLHLPRPDEFGRP